MLYKIINYETLFQTVKSKILIIDRFYKTSAIKNFIFKKHGGKITSCTQKNICEFTISFFVNTDVLFSLGTRPPTLINKLGGKIKKFIPVGSLPMEHFWYNYWSKKKEGLKKIPEYDIMIVGLNYANAPDRMYIDKKHYSYYY